MPQSFVEQLTSIIRENIDNADFSIEVLCQEIGMSRSQLHRKLKAEIGISTSLYIRQIRLEKALDLLENTTLNISEICYETGFLSPQNFAKYFKTAYGASPSKYRKAFLEKEHTVGKKVAATVVPQIEVKAPLSPKVLIAESATPLKKNKRTLVLAAFGLLSLVALFFFYTLSTPSTKPANELTIAVLPFSHEGFLDDQYLGEGITEDVLIHLNKIPTLKIISKSSSFKYQKAQQDIQAIGQDLLSTHVLQGRIKKENNAFNIFLQLIRVEDNSIVWSEKYNRNNQNFLNVASAAALGIAKRLNQPINQALNQQISHLSTKNVVAYNAYLLGKYLMKDRTNEGLEKSLEQYDLALSSDPDFIPAHIAKATAYFLLSENGEQEYLKKAEKLALQIIKIDKNNGEAYALLGNINCTQRNFNQGLAFYEVALDLEPNNGLINYWYSIRLREIGNFEGALAFGKLATELDPLHPIIHAGYVYSILLDGQYSLAEEVLNEGSVVFGNHFLHIFVKGKLEMYRKNYTKALALLAASLQLNPNFRPTLVDKFACLAKLGRRAEVDTYLATLDENNPSDCITFAAIHSALAEFDKGLFYLQKAANKETFSNDLLVGGYYKPYQNYPVGVEILKKSGLYEYYTDLEKPLISGK